MDDWLTVLGGSEPGVDRARQSLLQVAEEVSGSGSWAWEVGSERLVWSENLGRLWQLPSDPGQPLSTIFERVHLGDQRRVRAWVEWIRSGHVPPDITFRIQLPGGTVRFMEVRAARREADGTGEVVVGWVQDVTRSRQADREIACHLAVASVLAAWDETEDGVVHLLQALASALGVQRARIWVLGDDGELEPRWIYDEPGLEEVVISGELLTVGRACVAVAWRRRRPLWIGGIRDEPGFPVENEQAWAYIRNGLLVPLTAAGETLAVITLPGVDELEITDRLMATLAGIGTEIGAFLSTHATLLTPPVLTPREIEILRLASEGLPGPVIAERLYVSPATIKTHFENIYDKYGVPDRVAAVARAFREGLLR